MKRFTGVRLHLLLHLCKLIGPMQINEASPTCESVDHSLLKTGSSLGLCPSSRSECSFLRVAHPAAQSTLSCLCHPGPPEGALILRKLQEKDNNPAKPPLLVSGFWEVPVSLRTALANHQRPYAPSILIHRQIPLHLPLFKKICFSLVFRERGRERDREKHR